MEQGSRMNDKSMNSRVSKTVQQIQQRGTLGAPRPQTCARGLNPLDPYLANKDPGKKAATSACSLGRRKLVGFWPKKAGKIRWESKLSPSDSSPAFPGCKASGLAAFSRRARSTTAASLSLNEVQEMKSPGSGVQGAEEAPCFVYVHSCVSPGEKSGCA